MYLARDSYVPLWFSLGESTTSRATRSGFNCSFLQLRTPAGGEDYSLQGGLEPTCPP
jgi:hypothetical protein